MELWYDIPPDAGGVLRASGADADGLEKKDRQDLDDGGGTTTSVGDCPCCGGVAFATAAVMAVGIAGTMSVIDKCYH